MSKQVRDLPQPPKLRSWNEVVEEVSLPTDFAIAFMSGRPELLRIIERPLTAEETHAVAHAMAVILDTNQELQRHARQVAEMAEQALGNLKGVSGKLRQVVDFANFREPMEADPDDI